MPKTTNQSALTLVQDKPNQQPQCLLQEVATQAN